MVILVFGPNIGTDMTFQNFSKFLPIVFFHRSLFQLIGRSAIGWFSWDAATMGSPLIRPFKWGAGRLISVMSAMVILAFTHYTLLGLHCTHTTLPHLQSTITHTSHRHWRGTGHHRGTGYTTDDEHARPRCSLGCMPVTCTRSVRGYSFHPLVACGPRYAHRRNLTFV